MTLTTPASHAPIRVLVADRQPLFREAVARAVRQQSRFQLVADVGDGHSALTIIARDRPDVAVLDVNLPGLDGHRVLNAVVRDGLPTRVLLLGTPRDAGGSYRAIEAGAAGWLTKAVGAHELCHTITEVAGGRVTLTPEVQAAIFREIRRRARDGEPLLDEREQRVLALIAEGRSPGEIGCELHLSEGTVKSSLLRVYRQFGVSERAAAVAFALRRGLID